MQQQNNYTEQSSKNSIQFINMTNTSNSITYNLTNLQKNSVNYLNNERYIDDQFAMKQNTQNNNIKIRRLSQIYPVNSSLFIDLKTGDKLIHPTRNKMNHEFPSYLSQINMLPFHHFYNLIEPKFVNDQGFYYVTVCREGVLVKEVIDDRFYFDGSKGRIVDHQELEDCPWVHILVKVWSKLRNGLVNQAQPFQFIRAFSFPDWQVMNPSKQLKQNIINKLNKATKKNEYIIARTKNNAKVGYYGFIPNSASFTINGHSQQYGQIYIKIKSFINSHWNEIISDSRTKPPEEVHILKQHQSIIPLNQFLNIFNLLYSTSNKYYYQNDVGNMGEVRNSSQQQFNSPGKQINFRSSRKTSFNNSNKIDSIDYTKYKLNINARQTKAIVIQFQVQGNKNIFVQHQQSRVQVGLCLYFPKVKVNNLIQNKHMQKNPNGDVIPWCKVLLGSIIETNQADFNYMESVKQKMLYCQEQTIIFVTHSGNHEFVCGEYFKGYGHQLTFNLSLKPGKYMMRLKIQKLQTQYQCYINATTINGTTKIHEAKASRVQQITLLKDCLFKKAAQDKKFVTFVNPAKRGSWISCRNQYENLGYSYIAVHVVKNADNKLVINISPRIVESAGYIIKGHKHGNKEDYSITIDSDENTILIFKYARQWNGIQPRIWPPPGIQFYKIPRKKDNEQI